MKVLFISEFYPPESKGGGEISAHLLARELVKNKVQVEVLTSWFPGLEKVEMIDGVRILRRLKTGRDPRSAIDQLKRGLFFRRSLLMELSKLEGYEIVHCMNISSIPAVELRGKLGVPFVLHVNSPVPFCPKGTLMYKEQGICTKNCTKMTFLDCVLHSKYAGKLRLKPILKYNPAFLYMMRNRFEAYQKLLKRFDLFMPISTFMQRRLIFAGIDRKKIKVIYNITELETFSRVKSSWNRIPKVLYLGEYSSPKGPQLLVSALKMIKTGYEANFYGEGVLRKMLKQDSLGLPININGPIPYNEVPAIIEKHDIVVFPSLVGEAFGRSAVEAMAAGRPVIAMRRGGVVDIVDNKVNGYLVDDEKEMATRLKKLLDDKQLRKRISLNAKKKAMRFSTNATANSVIKAYANLKI